MKPVLLTGATGYVGGRLAPLLLARGRRVRAVGRSASRIRCRPWGSHPNLEIVEADLHDAAAFTEACRGCDVAYYLVHSMHARHEDFARADREAAYVMAQAARDAGLTRIIYLGGLGEWDDPALSEHLRSRAEVARILALSPAKLTFLRAAMLLGSGGASFEILRYLCERLPVMITPRWVRTKSQPIAVSNVLGYLAGCLDHPETAGRTFDIGGPDVLSYGELFQLYAEQAGLRRRIMIPVPVLTPYLSSLWLGLVTPVPTAIGRPLIEGLRNEAVCGENSIRQIIPQELLPCREAIRLALEKVRQQSVETCWSDAGAAAPPEWAACGDPSYAGGEVKEDGYRAVFACSAQDLWPHVAAIGGRTGWYGGDALWSLRGFFDRLLGGPGSARGRRDAGDPREGDAVDFWRVLRVLPNRQLLLWAEMKAPGEALLDFQLAPKGEDRTELTMIARFLPRGVAGLLYWLAVSPLHDVVFRSMFRGLAAHSKLRMEGAPERFKPGPANVCRIG